MSDFAQDNLVGMEPAEPVAETAADLAPDPCAQPTSEADIINCMLQAAEELNSTLDLDQVLERVAVRVRQYIEYDTIAIHLLDPIGQELRIRFGIGYRPEVIQHWRLGLGQGLVGIAAQTGKPVRVGDVGQDPRYVNAFEEIRSELAIPLIVKNRTVGVLDAGSRQVNYFTPAHQRILSFLAGHLANAIENARLYENLREQTRSLSLLHEVSRELTSILNREELLNRVAQRLKRLIDFQGFHVMFWNEQAQQLEDIFVLRYDERIAAKGRLPLGMGLCGTAAALRQPLRVANVHVDPRYVTCGDSVDVRSELVIPLVFKERLIGVLDFESTEYNAFTEQHEQMLSTLASYIAIAMENARLYEKVQEDEGRLGNDLAVAREIQKRLLPAVPPRLPGLDLAVGYLPARELGGDVYDFLPYGDGGLALAVGDVAGKATPAALYGALAIGILRGHMVEHPCPPAEMLEQMNEHLRNPEIDNRFIALLFAVYESRGRTLTLANAGFTRPRLVRGGRVEEIRVDGLPLGILPGTRYEEKKLALEVGDVVVFCSDGIHECVNSREEEFGLNRLESVVVEVAASGNARDIAEEILRATERYASANEGINDDRTVVVLRVTPE